MAGLKGIAFGLKADKVEMASSELHAASAEMYLGAPPALRSI